MKRILSILLLAVMITVVMSSAAFAWFCPDCGSSNDSNYCGYCGKKKPAATTAPVGNFRVTGASLRTDGSVTINWTGGSAPYQVEYSYYVNNNHNIGADVISWHSSETYNGTSATIDDCFVPGVRYWIAVRDSSGQRAWYDFSSRAGAFNYFNGARLTLSLRQSFGNRWNNVSSFFANEIENNLINSTFGATVKISTPNLSRSYYFAIRMAVFLPSGEPILMHTSYEEFGMQYDYLYWESYDFRSVWDVLLETKDRIPSGKYVFRIYADNMLLDEKEFLVK